MTQHMSGTWKAIDIEIYEIDDLGNPGNFLAMARDQRVATWMADTHNSMLAAARNAKKLIDVLIETNQVDPGGFVATALDSLNEAIAKAEGTKP